jgi:hypothetical protein
MWLNCMVYCLVMSPLTNVQRLLRKSHEALQDSFKRKQHLHGKQIFQTDSVTVLIPGSVGAGWRGPRCGSAMTYGTWDAAAFRWKGVSAIGITWFLNSWTQRISCVSQSAFCIVTAFLWEYTRHQLTYLSWTFWDEDANGEKWICYQNNLLYCQAMIFGTYSKITISESH